MTQYHYDLLTYTEAARMLGVRPQTMADLVKAWNIIPKEMPLNGQAKGLDQSDMDLLRRALNQGVEVAQQPSNPGMVHRCICEPKAFVEPNEFT